MFGRLRNGAAAAAAQHELTALSAARARETGNLHSIGHLQQRPRLELDRPSQRGRGPDVGFMGLLLGAACLVLLIAGVNVAAMLSARSLERRRELAVRAALGAGRIRLLRQLLTEILVLFLLGAFGGLIVTHFATAALEQLPSPPMCRSCSTCLRTSVCWHSRCVQRSSPD